MGSEGRRFRGLACAACAAALLWLNLYLCREALFLHWTGYANSMHGFWMALAGVPFGDWLRPTWWPYWDAGLPIEHTYAPLVPWLMRALSLAAGIPVSQAWHVTAALVFVLGPVTLFVAVRRLSGSIAYSLAAALVYSLASPSELLAPDDKFAWVHVGDARRLYLAFVWDEVPHLAALALFPLALLAWQRILERGDRVAWLLAVPVTAATVLANPFGGTLLALALLCLAAARTDVPARTVLSRAGTVGAAAYVLISPWLPPSLIAAIRRNSASYELGAWTAGSWAALLITVAVSVPAVWLLRRYVADWHTRFWLLLALVLGAVLLLHHHFDWHFLPQPGRYKLEFELALAPALVFAARLLLRRLPAATAVAIALALVPVGVDRVIAHRRFAKTVLVEKPAEGMVERQVAERLDGGGSRVFVPGSVASWINAFAPVHQLGGGSFPTALNAAQQIAVEAVYGRGLEPPGQGTELLWLKAFGVRTLVVSGAGSGEFWHPFRNPGSFAKQLPPLWEDSAGMTAYRVRAGDGSLAHVVPSAALVKTRPSNAADAEQLKVYTAAIDDPSLPRAEFQWAGKNRARIRARTMAEQIISVQVNHHPGWEGFRNGRRIPLRKDGLGLIWVHPPEPGDHDIDLRFTGGVEGAGLRLASLGVLLAGAWLLARRVSAS